MRYLDLPHAPSLPKLGLGTWQFGSREWGYGEEYAERDAVAIVHRALERGMTLIDTAEIYALGRSERIVGAALRALPDRAFVATKLFPLLPLAPVVEWRARASAKRLGVRHIDLYQVHWPNPIVRDGTTMRGMRALQDAGLVGAVGVSNYPLVRWRSAEAALGRPVLTNQVAYNLVEGGAERDLIPHAGEHGRIVIAHSPLARGFLSTRYDSAHRPRNLVRRRNPLFSPESLERAAPLFATLKEIGAGRGATPAQVALAWTIRHENVVAIVGASSVEQVDANAAAAELSLGVDEVDALSAAALAFRPS